jgi:ABC-2 type transport system permease protein
MWGSTRAELVKMVRRPASWLMLAVAVTLGLTFAYLIPYAGYASASSDMPNSDRGLATMLPDQVVGNAIGGSPMFFGAIALVMGVLTVGGEYGWGTWKTVLTQGPSRVAVFGGKVIALIVANLVAVLAMFAASAAASAIIAVAEDESVTWPGLAELATGVGAEWLILTMWTMLGALLAVLMRGIALPIGLGLVWLLAVQNLLASIAAPLLDWVADAQKALPGPNAGSLVASLGTSPATPGVAELVDSGQATLVLCGYLVVFTVITGWLLRRRDVV